MAGASAHPPPHEIVTSLLKPVVGSVCIPVHVTMQLLTVVVTDGTAAGGVVVVVVVGTGATLEARYTTGAGGVDTGAGATIATGGDGGGTVAAGCASKRIWPMLPTWPASKWIMTIP
jgi:hypothetical protein